MLTKSLCAVCGLTMRELADLVGVPIATVKNWFIGRVKTPPQVIQHLVDLHGTIERSASEALAEIERQAEQRGDPGVIELGLASDDTEAQFLGFPTQSVHRVVLGLVAARGIARGYNITIVPRGSTAATAAAADQAEKRYLRQ